MRLTTKGRFAVTAMIDLALRQQSGPVTLAGISQRQGISLQKELMQELALSFGEDQNPRNSSFTGKAKRFWADILGAEATQ